MVEAEKVQLQDFVFLGVEDDAGRKAAVSFRDAALNAIRWSGDAGLQGDTLTFDDLVATIVRDKEGNINISRGERRKAGAAYRPARTLFFAVSRSK